MVRMMLPKVLPPTYRGTAVRYLYYVTTTMHWSFNVVENGHGTTPAVNSALECVVNFLTSFLHSALSPFNSLAHQMQTHCMEMHLIYGTYPYRQGEEPPKFKQ